MQDQVSGNDQREGENPQIDDVLALVGNRPLRRSSCSLPAAIKLPVNVSEPRMTSSPSTAIVNRGTLGACSSIPPCQRA